MGKKSSPKAPDYTKLAQQQAQEQNDYNAQNTWANRVNQSDPYGSSNFTATKGKDPVTGKPVTMWSQKTTLNPQMQAALDAQMGLNKQRSQLAQSLFGGLQGQLGKPLDYSKFQGFGAVPQAQKLQAMTSGTTGLQALTNPNQRLQTTTDPNAFASLIGGAGKNIQGSLNFSGLNDVTDGAATRKRAEENIYKQAASRLDPQWQQRQRDMETQLANRGITSGSEAYSRAMDSMNRSRTDAYDQAQMSAITGAGAEAERDYGMDMGLRQQQMNEILSGGQFANSAQAQKYGQMLDAGQFGLGAQNQAFDQRAQAGQFGLNSQQQAFGQRQAVENQRLAAQQQAFGQRQAAGNQNFDQQLASSGYQNDLRQQQIMQAMQQKGFGLDQINALLSGTQVQGPQFQNYNQAGMGQATDYMGAANSAYGAANNAANAKQAGQANTMNTVATVGSAALMFF